MKRLFASTILAALVFTLPEPGLCEGRRLASGTGSLLRGTVYKHSGMERDGFVTIRTGWKVPTVTPVYRYDFDLLRGKIDKTFFSYLLADVAEIEFLPLEEGRQPVNVKLRNGVVQKVTLVSEDRPVV
ncbi:MAG TPA: hypothetical protein VJM83_01460, partial [Nitrospirota bacterium]|nr:hypothetical protein [Nitrospirota bacterium]